MNTWIKRLGITVGVLVLTFGLAFVALSVTSQQIGMSGKQVYSYDSATGFARMEVVVNSITGLVDAAGDSLVDAVNNALQVTLVTLLSGEDQTNNLLMTSGGVARGTEGNIINSAVGDATSAAFQLPTGSKTLTARITGAGAVVQTLKIYGGTSTGMAAATSQLLCTINLNGTSGAAGTGASCDPITSNHLYYLVVTSASSGTPTTILTAQY